MIKEFLEEKVRKSQIIIQVIYGISLVICQFEKVNTKRGILPVFHGSLSCRGREVIDVEDQCEISGIQVGVERCPVLVDEHDFKSRFFEGFGIPIVPIFVIGCDFFRERAYSLFREIGLFVTIENMETFEEMAVIAGVSGKIERRTVSFPESIQVAAICFIGADSLSTCRNQVSLKIAVVEKRVKVYVVAIILREPSLVLVCVYDFDCVYVFLKSIMS
jgi:hypothetical protein